MLGMNNSRQVTHAFNAHQLVESGKMKLVVLSLVAVALSFLSKCSCANILAVTTLGSPSHYIWHRAYLLNLVRNGHNITLLTHDEEKDTIANFTVLTLEGVYDKIHKDFIIEDLVYDNCLQAITSSLFSFDETLCQYDLETATLKNLLNYPEDFKFDLMIWDINSGKCLYSLIDRFGTPPVIATSPFGIQPHIDYIFGNHIYSYIPFFQMRVTNSMVFSDRLVNFFYVHLLNFFFKYVSIPHENQMARSYFGNDIRQVDEFERTISLLLVNIDPVLHYPQPIPPNIIPVGGLHIQPANELPQDLRRILDGATNGAILVTFGTNLNFKKFGQEQKQAFVDAFKRIPQTVLMKLSKSDLRFPKNVIVRDWLPQNDILGHPNVKLFINHGGLLSTQEAIYHGIPVVGMPFYLDQLGNIENIVSKHLGQSVDYFNVTPDIVYYTITEVLNNPVYLKNMKIASKRFRDQPQTPLRTALFWTEYILRHGTAEHINPATRDMSIVQRFDLDILLLLLSIFLVVFILSCITIRFLYNLLLRGFCSEKKVDKVKRS